MRIAAYRLDQPEGPASRCKWIGQSNYTFIFESCYFHY